MMGRAVYKFIFIFNHTRALHSTHIIVVVLLLLAIAHDVLPLQPAVTGFPAVPLGAQLLFALCELFIERGRLSDGVIVRTGCGICFQGATHEAATLLNGIDMLAR